MPWTDGEELSPEEMAELCGDVRDMAIQQLADGLRRIGVPQTDIDKAIIDAKAQNSDAPLLALAKP